MRSYIIPRAVFHEVPTGAIPRDCTMPEVRRPFDLSVQLTAPARLQRIWAVSHYAGYEVPDTVTDLGSIVREELHSPSRTTVYNTNMANFRKIACVKAVVAVTSWTIKEAKEFVEEVGKLQGVIVVVDFVQHES